MTHSSGPPRAVIESYALDPDSIERLAVGLINQTYSARRTDGSACILQRVSSIFPPAINDDIDAVTRHLHGKGLTTPKLVPTVTGEKYWAVKDDTWRLLTRVEGETVEVVPDPGAAREAGHVLGTFHAALSDFDQPLICQRPGVHDIDRHIGTLLDTLAFHTGHAAHAGIASLTQQIVALTAHLQPLPDSPHRLVHGDPKISNVIFNRGLGVCLVDLDTISRMPVAFELGDALRSWCNPATEDSPEARFSIEHFRASLEGYRLAAPDLLSPQEWRAVPNATLAIALELSARFAADALNETYFSWDRKRFRSASQHNLARAAAQLKLAADVEQQMREMREVIVTLA